jgi:hypothetical protein
MASSPTADLAPLDGRLLTQQKVPNASLQKPEKDKAVLAGVQTISG